MPLTTSKAAESEGEKPYLEIEVIKLVDPNRNEREILEIIKKRSDKNNSFMGEWIGSGTHPKLRFVYPSLQIFENAFCRGLDVLDSLLDKMRKKSFDIEKLLSLSKPEKIALDNKIFLILKYTTNYKKPLRLNYEYIQWFANYFHEMVHTEEVVDGFLHFYKRDVDFQNANLDKLDPQELRTWIKNKKPDISDEIMQQLLTLISKREM